MSVLIKGITVHDLSKDAPTVDVVSVVRCKDCKYGIDWDGRLGCKWHGFYQTEPNWFCADGERSEDGET